MSAPTPAPVPADVGAWLEQVQARCDVARSGNAPSIEMASLACFHLPEALDLARRQDAALRAVEVLCAGDTWRGHMMANDLRAAITNVMGTGS